MAPARLGPRILRRRDTSHGCQNHTTWPYAARSTPSLDGPGTLPPKSDARRFSIGRRRAVRSLTKPQKGPPCDDVCAPDAAASTAPRPAFSDDRETPLCEGRDTGSCMGDLGETKSGLFLREERFLI